MTAVFVICTNEHICNLFSTKGELYQQNLLSFFIFWFNFYFRQTFCDFVCIILSVFIIFAKTLLPATKASIGGGRCHDSDGGSRSKTKGGSCLPPIWVILTRFEIMACKFVFCINIGIQTSFHYKSLQKQKVAVACHLCLFLDRN